MHESYFYQRRGIKFGPTSLEVILRLVRQGELERGDRFCRQGHLWEDVSTLVSIQVSDVADLRNQTADTESASRIENGGENTRASSTNKEMLRLFAECLERQRPTPLNSDSVVTRSSIGLLGEVTSFTKATFASAWNASFAISERLLSIVIGVFSSRVVWGVISVVLLALLIPTAVPWIPTITANFATQEQVYSQLEQIFQEWEERQWTSDDTDQMSQFEGRSASQLASLVPVLQRNATRDDRASLALLWIARDYLPALLKDSDSSFSEIENKVRGQLAVARSELQ